MNVESVKIVLLLLFFTFLFRYYFINIFTVVNCNIYRTNKKYKSKEEN